jgi:hypothetical protein
MQIAESRASESANDRLDLRCTHSCARLQRIAGAVWQNEVSDGRCFMLLGASNSLSVLFVTNRVEERDADDVVCWQAQPADSAYFVLHGSLSVMVAAGTHAPKDVSIKQLHQLYDTVGTINTGTASSLILPFR